ncbi:hypothetical protein WN943_023147 [Citrus x changshan-huyou]
MENMLQPEDDATAEEKHETENQPADGATAEEKNETENKTSISGNDSDIDKNHTVNSSGKNRLFGRQKPVHHVLGGGKCNATLVLWVISIIGSWFDFLTILYLGCSPSIF